MSGLQHTQSFRDLIIYKKSRQLQQEIFNLTKSFPRDETFSLTDQVRRSSRSIGANLAEAWAKRRYEKHFISKLTDSDGEQMETHIGSKPLWTAGILIKNQALNFSKNVLKSDAWWAA